MRDNPIHTFFQVLGGNIPDQLNLGGFRWFEVVLYWVLLIGSLTIAYTNWRLDSTQRTGTHLSIYAMRLVSAGMWYLGTLWKLPLPISAGFKYWLENTVKYSSFDAHASIMQVFLDHIALVQPLVYLLETALAVSLMLGIAVRLAGIVGVLFILNLSDRPLQRPDRMAVDLCRHHLRPRHVRGGPGRPQPRHRQPAGQTSDSRPAPTMGYWPARLRLRPR